MIVISVQTDQLRGSKYLSAGTMVENMALAAENIGIGACMNMAALPSLPQSLIPPEQTPLTRADPTDLSDAGALHGKITTA